MSKDIIPAPPRGRRHRPQVGWVHLRPAGPAVTPPCPDPQRLAEAFRQVAMAMLDLARELELRG